MSLVLEPPGSSCSKTDGWAVSPCASPSCCFKQCGAQCSCWSDLGLGGEAVVTLSAVGVAHEALVHVQGDKCGPRDSVALSQSLGWAESPAKPSRARNASLQNGPHLRVPRADSDFQRNTNRCSWKKTAAWGHLRVDRGGGGRDAQALEETRVGVGRGSQNPVSGGSSWHLQSQIEVVGVKQQVLRTRGGNLANQAESMGGLVCPFWGLPPAAIPPFQFCGVQAGPPPREPFPAPLPWPRRLFTEALRPPPPHHPINYRADRPVHSVA